jgi:hypothetical protein
MVQRFAGQPPEIAAGGLSPAGAPPFSRDQARTVFGQVMGLVALTLGTLALGAYIGRDLSGGLGILFFTQASHASSASAVRPRAGTSSSPPRCSSASGSCSGWRSAPS